MGCVCCSLSSFVSIILDALERISLCTVCALLMCCLLFTILTVLAMGIGIGYHYCFVQNSADAIAKAAKTGGNVTSSPETANVLRSVEKVIDDFSHRLVRREASAPPQSNENFVTKILNKNQTQGNQLPKPT